MVSFEPSIPLPNANNIKMPMFGLGTWQSKPNEVQQAVEYALDIGYRHIDTAFIYGNEKEIGEAVTKKIKEGVVKREDIFITTKLWCTHQEPEHVLNGLKMSLKNLQTDYVDLYLIHNTAAMPYAGDDLFPKDKDGKALFKKADHVATWKEMEKAVDQGLVKAIGLSNFNKRQTQNVLDHCRIKPANMQVECHAYFMQKPLFDFCKQHGITFTAYGSMGSPTRMTINPEDPILLEDPKLNEIAKRINRTPAQILNRYLVQRERIVIPKSVHKDRIKQNFEALDFTLNEAELKEMDSLDKNIRLFDFLFVRDSPDFPFDDAY